MVKRHDDAETDESFEQRSVTYKWLVAIAVAMVFGLIGVIYSSVDKRVSNAEARIEKKIDREEHYKDMGEIRSYMQEIRQMLHNHEENSRKRVQ